MNNRYSYLIPTLSLLIDILLINGILIYINDTEYLNLPFLTFANLFWIVATQLTSYYKITRQTSIFRLFSLIAFQTLIFVLGFFSFFTIFREGEVVNHQFRVLTSIIIITSLVKILIFYALKWYRKSGMNYRKVVLIGYDENSKSVLNLLKNRSDLGYRFQGFFTDTATDKKGYLGNLKQSFEYLKINKPDELYCSLTSLKKDEVKAFTKFANQNNIVLKLIPEANELYSKNVKAEYYDNSLVLSVKKLPLEIRSNRIIKRVFDVFFSLFVLVFVMSWLTPLLGILIKLESRGPVFFRQEREGLNGHKFTCYKFRSMKLNKLSHKIHAKENDTRVTKIGAFIRRTSIDEMPQFYNVLFGDMSVVGPRPHMENLAIEYQKDIDNYMERHAVKPGITGLAQVSGYRGEVKKKSDIKNRIRLDVFYIENWSILLDIKIIINTIFNVIKGDEKAY